ncbi:hypothetical protein [Tenacibaculum piscium]|uniref:hypothetical protein n=1 Tax=Tenacibaculum piscium TaxID=1458515 RepID=UPI001F1FC6B7|nr:hypothetical protein [Tenacibaculum piscium]
MAITPSELIFNYKKGTSLPPSRVVSLNIKYTHQHISKITYDNKATSWLTIAPETGVSIISLGDTDNESIHLRELTISLNDIVKNLESGKHSIALKVYNSYPDYHFSVNDERSTIFNDLIGSLNITVHVTDDLLIISPSTLIYDSKIGDTPILTKKIKITSNSDWVADFSNCNWITESSKSGIAGVDKDLSITVNTTGLQVGKYTTGIPIVNSGGSTRILNVTLNITSGGEDYLYAAPKKLLFNYTISGDLPLSKRIELNASKQWTATTEAAWLLLSVTEGVAGVGFFDIGIQNVAEFTAGEYSAVVKITVGSVEEIINVVLVVRSFTKETLSEKTLYFSDDQNNIIISSEGVATYLSIDISVKYNSEIFKYASGVPFFNGTAKKRIGAVVNKIINNEPDLLLNTVSLKTSYLPALLTINVQEAEIYSDEIIEGIQLKKIPFVKGITPFDNWLSDNNKEMYLTNKGVVSFSFYNPLLTAVTEIVITGSVTKTVTFPAVSSYFNTVQIPLNLLNLKEGDAIIITAHNTIVTVFIKPNTPDNALVFWENKWGVFDSVEFTGDISEKDNYKSKDFSYRKDHLTTETKVLSVENKTSFKLNTGPLYTYESIDVVSKMLKSRNIKLIYQNEIIAVKSTTKTLSRPKISENNRTFDLTFEKLLK